MKLEAFLERFDQFAEAPDAVAKMRELVLELAVRGKLTQQVTGDDSAEQLLQAIHAEKISLVNEGLLKKTERLEPLTEDANELRLPPQWRAAPLAALCVSVTDGDHLPPPKADHGFPFLVISDVRWGGISFDGCRHVSADYFEKLDWIRKPRKHDILYTLVGSFGIPIVVRDSRPFCVQRHIGILRPSKHIEHHYLAYALASKLVLRQAASIATGIAQKTVPLAGLRKIVIPVPPLAEQKRIVAKVGELTALCDRLEAQQREREQQAAKLARASLARFANAPTPPNLAFLFHPSFLIPPADLRQSILEVAVQGKLVPQDTNDKPAEGALRRCGVDMTRWAVPEDEQRKAIPSSWTWVRFAGVGEQRLGKMLDAQKNRGGSKPYLRNTNVQWMRFELADVKEMRVDEREEDELRLKSGDLLICEGGEPGRCAIWREEVDEMYFQKALHRVRPCEAILSEFLALNLQLDCRNEVLASYFTGATIKHLTGRSLSKYPVPIPPLAEQLRIVAKVDQLTAWVDKLEAQLASSRSTSDDLLSALVAELTTQTGGGDEN
jgi:type I restriction enzyme, S subunit